MKSILIVEDDTDLRSSISEILISEGFEVTQASTGQEGLDEFEKGKFDIVLTDFRLPEMGGLALIERIREKTHPDTGCPDDRVRNHQSRNRGNAEGRV